jgi:hypothetical protein
MKAYLIVNKRVKTNNNLLLEGVFWKKKNAREYARQLIWKTGSLNYKFLYSIVIFTFEENDSGNDNPVTDKNHFKVILHTLRNPAKTDFPHPV